MVKFFFKKLGKKNSEKKNKLTEIEQIVYKELWVWVVARNTMDNVEMERARKQGEEALRIQKINYILKWGDADSVEGNQNEGLDQQMYAMDKLLVKQLEEARNAVAAAKALVLARRPSIVEGCRCGSGKAVVGVDPEDWNLIQSLHCMCPDCGAPYADLGKCKGCRDCFARKGGFCPCCPGSADMDPNKYYMCTPGGHLPYDEYARLSETYPHLNWSYSKLIGPSMDFF